MSDTNIVQKVSEVMSISTKEAKEIVDNLSFRKFLEVFRAAKNNDVKGIQDVFGITEIATINNVRPMVSTTASQNNTVMPPTSTMPDQTIDKNTFKPGQNMTITTVDGELSGEFNKMLPDGTAELKVNGQFQKVDLNDKENTVNVDETTSGCVASGGSSIFTQRRKK